MPPVSIPLRLRRFAPEWLTGYTRDTLISDVMAAVIVTIMLIPQSLAYAMLAGLPPQVGLYASILPLVAYAAFGSSRVLAVGPVAVVSLMTAAAVGRLGLPTAEEQIAAAILLAMMSGGMLVIMGVLRLGLVANFLSHPVIAGFITASGILIAASQFGNIIGVKGRGENLPEILHGLWSGLGGISIATTVIGVAALAFLFWVRSGLKPLLIKLGLKPGTATIVSRTGPVMAVAATTLVVWAIGLGDWGVATVGAVPGGLPPFGLPDFDLGLVRELWLPALLISIIGFVESVSVARTLAARRREVIRPDKELLGLGAANIAAGLSGGYPVTGGFARSVVNADAGAETPAAGAFTAIGILVATLVLTPLLYHLPKATLSATVIVAVLSLVDFKVLKHAWTYNRTDFAAVAATLLVTLGFGVETGVATGVILSVGLHLIRSTRPHVAEVGIVPGTQHFRNILRHRVETDPAVVSLRIDESLYFANAAFLGDYVYDRVARDKAVRHVVLMCSAVNEIDLSALESLEALNTRLKSMDIRLHLSEVKGPVMDRLKRSHFLHDLTGEVFLAQWDAVAKLSGKTKLPVAA